MTSAAISAYTQNAVRIESQDRLIELLYEGILRFCVQAKRAIENGDIEKRVYYINKASDIFVELINSLNFDVEGDIPHYLNGLYAYQLQLLATANFYNRTDELETVMRVARGLLEAWREKDKPAQ
ncbi:MAG: flagellar export chaperone FliS [Campylobacterales bacterium]